MTFFVTWPGAEKYHSVALKPSSGVQLDGTSNRVSSTTGEKSLLTHCGREIPAER